MRKKKNKLKMLFQDIYERGTNVTKLEKSQ